MEQEKKKKTSWVTIVLFIFGLLMLAQAFRETNIISISTAVIVGGLLVLFTARDIWKKG